MPGGDGAVDTRRKQGSQACVACCLQEGCLRWLMCPTNKALLCDLQIDTWAQGKVQMTHQQVVT